ncbi:MAG: hypothetical protein V4611_04490 [Patescibacteria group bacterium]
METSLRKLFEKHKPVAVDVPLTLRNPKEYAQFTQDIDRTWVSDQNAGAMGYSLMEHLREVPEEDAALLLSELLKPYLELDLNTRLNAVGILVGELTPGRSTPSGVRSILRSGTPMVLMTENNSPDFHRPSEIARAIGEMVCGHGNEEAIVKFLRAFDPKVTLEDGTQPNSIE